MCLPQKSNGPLLLLLLLLPEAATTRYEGSSHRNVFGHLTNSSINRKSPFASHDKDVIGDGCKWTLRRLRGWVEESFENGGERWSRLWAKIRSMICLSVLTLADVVPGGPSHSSCFELFGVDVMVDSSLSRAHLLEINCSPALGLEEDSDRKVKLPLIEDLLDLLDVESYISSSSSPPDDESIKREKQNGLPRFSKPRDSIPRQCKKFSVTRLLDPQTRIRSRAEHAKRADHTTDEGLHERLLFSQGVRRDKRGLIEKGNKPLSGSSTADPLCPESEDAETSKIHVGAPLKPPRPITSPGYGGFELVFPFNEDSRDQARRLSQCVRAGAAGGLVQGCIRAIIAEIKAHERKYIMALRRRPQRMNDKE